jgi:hypothetical protein
MGYALGVMAPPNLAVRTFLDYAMQAERHGFDEVWFAEDCFLKGGISQAAVALASTSRIVVGVGILPSGARNVAFAALEIAFLTNLYPGRLMVGIGHGMADWMRQVGAHPSSPLTLLQEYLQALRALLAGETVTFSGRHIQLSKVRLDEPPAIPPQVLAGVRGPKSLALSGEYADGTILAEPVTPEYLASPGDRSAQAKVTRSSPTTSQPSMTVPTLHDLRSGRRWRSWASPPGLHTSSRWISLTSLLSSAGAAPVRRSSPGSFPTSGLTSWLWSATHSRRGHDSSNFTWPARTTWCSRPPELTQWRHWRT